MGSKVGANCLGLPYTAVRVISIIFSVLIAIFGLLSCLSVLFSIGDWETIEAESVAFFISGIVVGVITMICAILGTVAAWKQQKKGLLAYMVLCFVFIALNIGLLILGVFSLYIEAIFIYAVAIVLWFLAFYFALLLWRGDY